MLHLDWRSFRWTHSYSYGQQLTLVSDEQAAYKEGKKGDVDDAKGK